MDILNMGEMLGAQMSAGTGNDEISHVHGHYDITCTDADGNVLWANGFDNLVTTVGKSELLASGAVGTAYMGLIGASGFTGVAVGDTMTSHTGWLEANGANAGYGAARPTVNWGSINNGTVTATTSANFVFTAGGTIEGAFVVNGSGASATVGSTTGSLLSAGTIAAAQPIISGNTITMTYTLNLT